MMQKIVNPLTSSIECFAMIPACKRPLIVQGYLTYNDNVKCHNVLRFKKKLIDEFPDLKRAGRILYTAEYWRTSQDLLERIEFITTKQQGVPVLLFLTKG